MNPFRILGVARNAGSAEIKRAYATKLKVTRPDDDPAGFQRLHEAFKTALQQARAREARQEVVALQAVADAADEDGTEQLVVRKVGTGITVHDDSANFGDWSNTLAEQAESGLPDPVADTATEQRGGHEKSVDAPFDFPAFVAEFNDATGRGLPAFERWLNTHPALYSLSLKQELVIPLLQCLSAQEPPPRPKWLAAVLHFFLLDTVAQKSFHVRNLIDSAQAHSQRYWQVEELAERYRGNRRALFFRLQFRELMGPRHAARRTFLMLCPGMKNGLWRITRLLAEVPEHYQRRVADPDAIAFWRTAIDPARMGKWRVTSMAVQLTVGVSLLIVLTYPGADPIGPVIAGIIAFVGWWLLKYNDARKMRRSRKPL